MPLPPIKARELTFDEYLEIFYKSVGPNAERDPEIQALLKADDRFDFGSTDYFNPVYSMKVMLEGLTRQSQLYRLLPKTSYIDKGDSLHYISADATYLESALGEEGALFSTDTNIPTISDLNHCWPAVTTEQWESTEVGTQMSKFQKQPVTDADFLKDFFQRKYMDNIDKDLAGVYLSTTVHGVDTPSFDGSTTYSRLETIDRMISNYTESGVANTHVSLAEDGDIYWDVGSGGTIKINRSSDTWANAQIKLPTTPGTEQAYNILDELDDLMAEAKNYAPTDERNYIGLCSPKAMNKIQDEIDPKQSFLEFPMDIYQNINGVSTRPGRIAGKTSVSALAICGLKVPFFDVPYLGGVVKGAWVWENAKYTTGGVGNIYLVNMDNIEIRHLIPTTYLETPNYGDWILGKRHVFYSAMQLLCTNFASHAALKYIKA